MEFDQRHRALLGFDHGRGKPGKPVGDLRLGVVALQRVVIALAFGEDSGGERNHRWTAESLSQRLLRDRATDAPIAVFKRMDAREVEMRDPGSRHRWQTISSSRGRTVEPFCA